MSDSIFEDDDQSADDKGSSKRDSAGGAFNPFADEQVSVDPFADAQNGNNVNGAKSAKSKASSYQVTCKKW